MIRLFLLLALLSVFADAHAQEITMLHFTDYHSHALPFYSEDRPGQGGIAHAIGFLERERARGALVFNGGDTINKGAPAWSDKYRCAEWPWFNGLVDAMAYGNHDSDYGASEFERCRSLITYPILGANVVSAEGKALFDVAGKPYIVIERSGRRIGVFAVAGEDFESLVADKMRPGPGVIFRDRAAVARTVVSALREKEQVDAVVMIGHAHREDDEALARAVPGIDLIFGTHSHLKVQLGKISGTSTWFISPYQYLTYVSRVTLRFAGNGSLSIEGGLVPISRDIPPSPAIVAKVDSMQQALASDPLYADLFRVVGRSPRSLSIANQNFAQTPLAGFILDIVRKAAGADLAVSTTSSFRRGLPAGPVTMEDLRATLPYPNQVLVYELSSSEVEELLHISESKRGSDSFAQWSRGKRKKRIYRVATTDYLARVAPGYREFFDQRKVMETSHEVRDLVRRFIETNWK